MIEEKEEEAKSLWLVAGEGENLFLIAFRIIYFAEQHIQNMAASTSGDKAADDSLYPIAVLIDELKNEDIQVSG